MKIVINRSGGLAGGEPEEVARVDTSGLTPSRAEAIEGAVRELRQRTPEIGADLIQYEIVVQDRMGQSTIVATEDGDPRNPVYKLLNAASAP
ncbi:MAG: protealysin inhibitor emfourin [Thiohalomonadaceae bacterium]